MNSQIYKYAHSVEYLFHGSAENNITILQPRQAMSFGRPDGPPSISAASELDPAIFMAIFGRASGGAMGIRPDKTNPFGLVIPHSIWVKATNELWEGYIYVLEKNTFTPKYKESWEWRSDTSVKPIDTIKVSNTDLPKSIKIIDDYKRDRYVNDYMRTLDSTS